MLIVRHLGTPNSSSLLASLDATLCAIQYYPDQWGPRNLSPGGILKTHSFCQFLLVFMTMMHADIGYNKKICCSFPVFVILGADSQIFV